MPGVHAVATGLDAVVLSGERDRDIAAVVGRRVVNDEHPDVDAGLVEHAAHALAEEVPVPVARDDDADTRERLHVQITRLRPPSF